MENNNRNQQDQRNEQNQPQPSDRNREQNDGNRENVAGKEETFDNPQQGSQWDNYRSRSLGSNPEEGKEPNV